jgi:shikimate kinase
MKEKFPLSLYSYKFASLLLPCIMRIYLIGFMGCGKTTLGRRLASHAGMQFIDMDHYIEKRNFKTVPQIFAGEGESEFRQKERKALQELSQMTDVVIATGGGAPCFFDNMDVMNQTGKTIYLNIDHGILADRLLNSKTDRPLIRGKSKDELIAFIDKTMKERDKYYSRARYQITRSDVEMDEVLAMITKDKPQKGKTPADEF